MKEPTSINTSSTELVDVPLFPEPKKAAPKKASRIPDGWAPDAALIAEIKIDAPDVDLAFETKQFSDYWVSAPKGTKLDWRATWRNWMRKAQTEIDKRKAQTNGHRPYLNPTDGSAYDGDL